MQLVKSYVTGLKPYIQNELDLHEIRDMETAIRKAKATEKKLESSSIVDKVNPQRRENLCKYCGSQWLPGHKCENPKYFRYEADKNSDTPANSNRDEKRKKNTCRRCGEKWSLGHKCTTNHSYQCKIIDGKEVQVAVESDTSDSDREENSTNISLASITCIKHTYEEEESNLQNHVKPDKMQFVIERYRPPHL